ncbi:MAG: hypothetical protein K0R10_1932 [Alphaproteobacteria bacterium]|jgi:hypothetical protein|nr:hypothetical protein [Alphaproteobacteria bacterium]
MGAPFYFPNRSFSYMSFRLALAAALLISTATAAVAQTESEQDASPAPVAQEQLSGPNAAPMKIEVDEKTLQGEDAYVAALEKLTAEQKTEQETLDKQFFASMRPIMDIYELGGKVMFCLNSNKFTGADNASFVQSFKAFQKVKSDEQEGMWKKHRIDARKVDYMPHTLLDSHYSYIQAVQKAAAEQMVTQTSKAGGYNDTNCPEVQKILAIAHQKASESLKNGTLGTPPK